MEKPDDGPKLPPKPEKRITPEPPKAPKAPTIGDKARAGRMLSEFLRRVAQEKTELTDGTALEDGVLITKAEAMARNMFKIALGYDEVIANQAGVLITKKIKPSAGMMALIFDRIEGRAAPTNLNDDKKRTLPKKVSAENKKRINSFSPGDNAD